MNGIARTLFVTGTDTGVGKTRAACALLRAARDRGILAAGFKPLASGAEFTAAGLRNDDALALLEASAPGLQYDEVNPYCFAPPIAPHIAAREAGTEVNLDRLNDAHASLGRRYPLVVVEGAGGWRVPMSEECDFSDWVGERNWPVVLVVGLRLGCLNHAMLSIESIGRRAGLAGWIANELPPAMERSEATLEALRARVQAPYWGLIRRGAERIEQTENGFDHWLCVTS